MESILARALESTLKYWLKSFSRDQFKLQGRTVQLSNLDINGDALHASTGLPPALNVAQAKVGRLEIKLPSVSNVQIDPVIVQIDKLDLVLEERLGFDTNITQCRERCNNQSSLSVSKSSGYGFADKIADGMTLQVGTVNLMLETCGSAGRQGGATWTPPLASITIRKLLLYTTSENWQVVSLKEAREFSSNKKCIYVFKKLEWESLSVDLLPHPDMFNDERLTSINLGESRRDDDGAKRLFFGGERFLDSISGQAYITIHRTEQNNPLGLEVQLHVTEAVCPALSEPGLRALLRFMTGLYVCLNRGDVDPRARQSTEAAGCSLVAVIVDHIFLCIKDAEFQLELLMQSLFFSRASISDGELTKTMTRVMIGGFFLRDTFSRPPCTLVQPSMQCDLNKHFPVPNFASEKLWPRIYPLKAQNWQMYEGVPMLCMYSLQTNPSPAPPVFASQTVVQCQPVKINLQEESCLRITSFLADGIVVHPGAVLPDTSVNSFHFSLNEFDITIPVDAAKLDNENWNELGENCFTGARLHVEGVVFAQSPSLTFKLLSLEKDPACFSLWKDQPIDSSQRKWVMRATRLSLCLETGSCDDFAQSKNISDWTAGLWHCVELHDPCIEGAMVTADGHPLVTVPPPGGVVRIGIACRKYASNTSVEQLFFVLKLYAYIGRVSEEVSKIGRGGKEESRDQSVQEANGSNELNKAGSFGGLVEMVPSDTAVSLAVDELHLKFLESVPGQVEIQGPPLVQFSGNGLQVRVTHRTLGGAMAISSTLCWQRIQVDCVETELKHSLVCLEPKIEDLKTCPDGIDSFLHARMHNCSTVVDDVPQMRAVLWINGDRGNLLPNGYQNGLAGTVPFLDVNVVHVIPYRAQDAECHSLSMTAKVAGVRLGGGMTYNEALLHRFGILGPDGGPGEGLKKGLKNFSRGPLAKLLRSSPQVGGSKAENHVSEKVDNDQSLELGSPDDIEIDIQLQDWLFALEGAQDVIEGPNSHFFPRFSVPREQRCWHMAFRSLCVSAKSGQKSFKSELAQKEKPGKRHPVEVITVSVEGLLALKPQTGNCNVLTESDHSSPVTHVSGKRNTLMQDQDWRCKSGIACNGGVDLEVRMVIADNDVNMGMGEWVVDSLKGAVKEPVEVEATKEEVDYLVLLCKSEIESVSRITAGILKVLKLQGSIGQAAIVQLSNLGSGSLDQVITPDRFRRRSSIGSVTCTQSNLSVGNSGQGLDYTVSMLEQAVSESQNICTTLSRHLLVHSEETEDLMLSSSRIAPISVIANIKDLENQLEKMQTLLSNLRSEV